MPDSKEVVYDYNFYDPKDVLVVRDSEFRVVAYGVPVEGESEDDA